MNGESLKGIQADKSINTCGMVCPIPIIKTAEAVKTMKAGEILEVLATDGAISIDMPAWCHSTGNEYLKLVQEKDLIRVYVRKLKG